MTSQPSVDWLVDMIQRATNYDSRDAHAADDRDYARDMLDEFMPGLADATAGMERDPGYGFAFIATDDLDMLSTAALTAEMAFGDTPYDEMIEDAWPNVIKSVYPLIAKHVLSHKINEAPEVDDGTQDR